MTLNQQGTDAPPSEHYCGGETSEAAAGDQDWDMDMGHGGTSR
jgi:hypothetical protein